MIEISTALPEDNFALAELVQNIHSMHADVYPRVFKSNPDVVELNKYFTKILLSDNSHIYIARADGLPIGYVWADIQTRPDTVLIHGGVRLQIQHLYVKEKHHCSGIGAMLMAQVYKLSTDREIAEVSLGVSAFNTGAQEFYRKQGFETFELKMWRLF